MISVDLGNFVARRNPPYGYDTDITLRSLEMMGYDLVTIGEKEVSWGLDELDEALAQHGIRVISNNILDAETGKTRYEPWTVLSAGEIKVGVTAVIGGESIIPRTLKEREGITVADPIESSRRALEEMKKKKVHITVLLAHSGMEKAEEFADSLAGFDVILVGHGRRELKEPQKSNGVILMAGGARSDKLGELTLVWEDGYVRTFEGTTLDLKQDEGPVDSEIRAITWEKMELDENGNRVRKVSDAKAQSGKKDEGNEVEREARVDQEQYKKYLGIDNCALCHADVNDYWDTTPHSRAYATIAEGDDWNNPKCWHCHVTGFGERTGHSRTELQPELWNVQCEACHGRGTEHIRGPDRKKVDEATCRGCHTNEWSPNWDYAKYRSKIVCTNATRHGRG
ncbi:MAG: hypothetical protein JW958_04880 [Candidatus Eisenbacteria bacterium]|nr:hypothetical protein [Candidatus Eisenbacteria bacterium]